MNALLRIWVVVICVLGFGCVRSTSTSHIGRVAANAEQTNQKSIAVFVGGAVNEQGRYILKPPFTVDQAIRQAGGIDNFEEGQNRSIRVIHLDGIKSAVQRKDYKSLVLEDGDTLVVPRH